MMGLLLVVALPCASTRQKLGLVLSFFFHDLWMGSSRNPFCLWSSGPKACFLTQAWPHLSCVVLMSQTSGCRDEVAGLKG